MDEKERYAEAFSSYQSAGSVTFVQLTPLHVNGSPSKNSGRTASLSCELGPFDVASFRSKLGNGFEISKHDTTLESILSLLEKLQPIC